ncbi:MAG: hypothetical protein IJB57_01845 [Clostridia bacterium]|nr:hypothetical protein [Clostridia bacterium]
MFTKEELDLLYDCMKSFKEYVSQSNKNLSLAKDIDVTYAKLKPFKSGTLLIVTDFFILTVSVQHVLGPDPDREAQKELCQLREKTYRLLRSCPLAGGLET